LTISPCAKTVNPVTANNHVRLRFLTTKKKLMAKKKLPTRGYETTFLPTPGENKVPPLHARKIQRWAAKKPADKRKCNVVRCEAAIPIVCVCKAMANMVLVVDVGQFITAPKAAADGTSPLKNQTHHAHRLVCQQSLARQYLVPHRQKPALSALRRSVLMLGLVPRQPSFRGGFRRAAGDGRRPLDDIRDIGENLSGGT